MIQTFFFRFFFFKTRNDSLRLIFHFEIFQIQRINKKKKIQTKFSFSVQICTSRCNVLYHHSFFLSFYLFFSLVEKEKFKFQNGWRPFFFFSFFQSSILEQQQQLGFLLYPTMKHTIGKYILFLLLLLSLWYNGPNDK